MICGAGLTAAVRGTGTTCGFGHEALREWKVVPVGIAGRFVDCTIVVIQSGLTILAPPREATHPAQRMEVAAVAFGNGMLLEKANPLFRRLLRPVKRPTAWETCGARVADPGAKPVRSRVS